MITLLLIAKIPGPCSRPLPRMAGIALSQTIMINRVSYQWMRDEQQWLKHQTTANRMKTPVVVKLPWTYRDSYFREKKKHTRTHRHSVCGGSVFLIGLLPLFIHQWQLTLVTVGWFAAIPAISGNSPEHKQGPGKCHDNLLNLSIRPPKFLATYQVALNQ